MKLLAQVWLKREDRVDYVIHEEIIDDTIEARKGFLKDYTYNEKEIGLDKFKALNNGSIFEVQFLTESEVVERSKVRNMTKQEKIYYRTAIHHLFN